MSDDNKKIEDEIFKEFQESVHLAEGVLPHVFVVLGASVMLN
jgi:hypothetical protein